MIARSAYVQLRYNPLLLAGTLAGLLLLYVAPPAGAVAALVVALSGGAGAATLAAGAAGLAGWALMTASYVPMLRLYRLSALRAPALPLIRTRPPRPKPRAGLRFHQALSRSVRKPSGSPRSHPHASNNSSSARISCHPRDAP